MRARAWDALVLILVVVVMFEVLTTNQDVPLELSVPAGLFMTVPFVWGQRRPLPVAAVVLATWVAQGLAGDWEQEPQSELLPVCVAFWCLGAYVAPRPGRWAVVLGFAGLVLHQPDDVIVLGPLMAGVFAAGRLMQSREKLAAALQAERAQAERYAVAEERARIARELHDLVGHSLAMITVQAGAERLALGDSRPETSHVLNQIEITGRQTLAEMRRLLGVLRTADDTVDFTPQPGLAQVDALAERMSRSGLAVEVQVTGEPGVVSPGIDISAFRIIQEALTNVLKHAEADQARVRVTHEDGGIEIEVTNDGAGQPADRSADAPGLGLTGMRERIGLYGGSLEVGPAPDGGWRLVARLPTEAEAP